LTVTARIAHQTKGKVESDVKYARRNFLCELQGREPAMPVVDSRSPHRNNYCKRVSRN